MVALFDKFGALAGFFLEPDGRFLTAAGSHTAFLKLDSVYSYSGAHVGWWFGDYMRGQDGGILVSAAGATIPGLSLPAPATQFPIPSFPPNPAKVFTKSPPDRPPELPNFSSALFGFW
jgi:hypothetical protein